MKKSKSSIIPEGEFEIDKIIGKRIYNNYKEYLIQWKGYLKNEATWEPESNLTNAKLAIKKFEYEYEEQQKRRKKEIQKLIKKKSQNSSSKNLKLINDDIIINEVLGVFKKNNILYGKCKLYSPCNKKIIKIISTNDISQICPLALIKYYESKIIFNN